MATGRISNETRRQILEMSAGGNSPAEIAQAIGRNESSIARIIEGASGSSRSGGKKKKASAASEPARAPAAPPARRKSPGGGGGVLTHHFWLRPGLEITLELPADLSGDEAQRLASVIQSLPFQ